MRQIDAEEQKKRAHHGHSTAEGAMWMKDLDTVNLRESGRWIFSFRAAGIENDFNGAGCHQNGFTLSFILVVS